MERTGTFITKFSDYYSRNGERVKILKEHKGHDVRYDIEFSDGTVVANIYPEELHDVKEIL